jgi:hypothetical protein
MSLKANNSKSSKARLQVSERFNTLVSDLESIALDGGESSVLCLERHTPLSAQHVKQSLDEILSSGLGQQHALAHVVLDESGGDLFSADLVDEEAASVACLRKLHKIVQSSDGGGRILERPIVVVTNDTRQRPFRVKIVALVPDKNNSRSSSSDGSFFVYFFDPVTGNRDIENQPIETMDMNNNPMVKKRTPILLRYMTEGSESNEMKPLIAAPSPPKLSGSRHKKAMLCGSIHDDDFDSSSGWWCLFYALLLIGEGDDSFLQNFENVDEPNRRPRQRIGQLKNVLASHVDFLSNIDNEQNQRSTSSCQQTDVVGWFL